MLIRGCSRLLTGFQQANLIAAPSRMRQRLLMNDGPLTCLPMMVSRRGFGWPLVMIVVTGTLSKQIRLGLLRA